MTFLSRALYSGSSAGGALLAAATRSVAAVRPAAKPLHPAGDVVTGRVYRRGLRPGTGVAWLDEPGEDEVLVRLSRAIGLPGTMPDIHGLALRVPVPGGGFGDLLLASTGFGRLTRFVLTASRSAQGRPMTTLLPYRTSTGPLLIGARADGVETFELSCAPAGGDWRPFADLRLCRLPADDAPVSFDPVRHQLPGLEQYPAVARLREPAYHTARGSRS
jgi:hypothetical protein